MKVSEAKAQHILNSDSPGRDMDVSLPPSDGPAEVVAPVAVDAVEHLVLTGWFTAELQHRNGFSPPVFG
jgi:hypothetical protein